MNSSFAVPEPWSKVSVETHTFLDYYKDLPFRSLLLFTIPTVLALYLNKSQNNVREPPTVGSYIPVVGNFANLAISRISFFLKARYCALRDRHVSGMLTCNP
jgi:hypothetical protein